MSVSLKKQYDGKPLYFQKEMEIKDLKKRQRKQFNRAFENISRALVQRIEFHSEQIEILSLENNAPKYRLKNASSTLAKDEFFCVYARAFQVNLIARFLKYSSPGDELITGTLYSLANDDWINYYDHECDEFQDTVEVIFNSDNL